MGWVVKATSRPFYPRERTGTHCIGGWVGPRVGLDGCRKSRPNRDSIPDCPARSVSLYRLSYPGPHSLVSNNTKQVGPQSRFVHFGEVRQDGQCTSQRTIQTCPRNHCCRGKGISRNFTCFEGVSVAWDIQNTMRMSRTICYLRELIRSRFGRFYVKTWKTRWSSRSLFHTVSRSGWSGLWQITATRTETCYTLMSTVLSPARHNHDRFSRRYWWKLTSSVCNVVSIGREVEVGWNAMAHAQKPEFVFRLNGWVHLNQRGRQFSLLLAVEVCALAVVMLDTPRSKAVWRVLANQSIRQFPLHFPSRASPCAITFQLESTTK